ncbi:MAG: hypothetical protein ABI193_14275 [Minicystis sp.]
MRLTTHVPALLGISLLLLGGWPQAALAQKDPDETARALFIEGAKLGNQGRWGEARANYAASLALRPAPLTRYSLGVAQRETGHFADALASFRAFLAEATTPATTPYVQPAQAAVTDLLTQVGRLSLVSSPASIEGLRLTIDEQPVERTREWEIDPGPHQIVARAPGYGEQTTRFHVKAGALTTLSLTLIPSASPALAPKEARPLLPFVLFGAGASFLVAGTVVGLVAVKQARDAPTRGGPEARSAHNQAIAGDVLAGAGLVSVGVGVVLLLTQGRGLAQTGTMRVSMDERGAGPVFYF